MGLVHMIVQRLSVVSRSYRPALLALSEALDDTRKEIGLSALAVLARNNNEQARSKLKSIAGQGPNEGL